MDLNPQKSQYIKTEKDGILLKLFRRFTIMGSDQVTALNNLREEQELIESIISAKNEWINANMNFEYADDQEIIDYYAYKIKACQVKYEYFLRKAKEKGIKAEAVREEVY